MLRAMYDFQAPYENTLTFSEGDLFITLKKNNKDQDWLHVIDLKGSNGYAPSNYLVFAECSKQEEIGHIDKILKLVGSRQDCKAVVENLLEIKCKLEKDLNILASKQLYELTTIMQQNTKSTFQQAQAAVVESLSYLQLNILSVPDGFTRLTEVDYGKIPMDIRRSCGVDFHRLDNIVAVVMETASDQETEVTEENWNDLLYLITHADPLLCIAALERYDCGLLLQLVLRLQAESSWGKRKLILEILFHALQLLPRFLNVAINSVLPTELACDIRTTCAIKERNNERLYWSVRLLTATLCSEEQLSFSQHNELGQEFVEVLIQMLEADDDEKDLCSGVIHLLLALYRQFATTSSEDNPVLLSLGKHTICEALVEKIIILYNRQDDPLKEYTPNEKSMDSVTGFILGIFSRSDTARLFYTADLDVLLDVILRHLTDYGPGDKRRADALQLFYAIRKIQDPPYKKLDFAKCLKSICEESNQLGSSYDEDHGWVMKIFHEFPDFLEFK